VTSTSTVTTRIVSTAATIVGVTLVRPPEYQSNSGSDDNLPATTVVGIALGVIVGAFALIIVFSVVASRTRARKTYAPTQERMVQPMFF
jgi:hypothetical protein